MKHFEDVCSYSFSPSGGVVGGRLFTRKLHNCTLLTNTPPPFPVRVTYCLQKEEQSQTQRSKKEHLVGGSHEKICPCLVDQRQVGCQ